METVLGALPAAGLDLHIGQQKLRDLAVGQLAGQLHGLGPAGVQAGDEGLQNQFLIARTFRHGLQQIVRRGGGVAFGEGEPAGEEISDHTGRDLTRVGLG